MSMTEEHLRTFNTPLAASMWAFEQLSRRGGYAKVGLATGPKGRIDWSEVEDLALTITSDLHNLGERICARVVECLCAPPEYINPENVSDVTMELAIHAAARLEQEGVEVPHRAILRAMGVVALLRVRNHTHRPDAPMWPPIVWYAAAAGVHKRRMHEEPWVSVRSTLEAVLRNWRNRGLKALGERLQFKGIVMERRQ